MSFLDLYMNKNPLITGSDEGGKPIATIFGVPFDATHSYKPGCRFGVNMRFVILLIILKFFIPNLELT